VIDCAITGTLGGYKAKWFDGARFLYPLPINWGAGMSAINLNSWRKLDAATQKTLQTEFSKLERAIFEQNIRENDIGIACNTGGTCPEGPAGKMTLVPVSPGDVELRRQALGGPLRHGVREQLEQQRGQGRQPDSQGQLIAGHR
jgi:hypothetical protein